VAYMFESAVKSLLENRGFKTEPLLKSYVVYIF